MKHTVVYVDDSAIVRNGIKTLFQAYEDFELLETCSCGAEGIAVAMEKKPDILLIDYLMPDLNGCEVAKCVKAHVKHTKAVLLTGVQGDRHRIRDCRYLDDCLHKDMHPDEMIDRLRTIVEGKQNGAMMKPDCGKVRDQASHEAVDRYAKKISLTHREKEILECIAEGFSNADIAKKLYISETTVKTHVSSILRKLGQPNRAQAVLFAMQNQLIELPMFTNENTTFV